MKLKLAPKIHMNLSSFSLVCNTVNIIRVVHQLTNLGTEFKQFPNTPK